MSEFVTLKCSSAIADALGAVRYRPGFTVPPGTIFIFDDDGETWYWPIDRLALPFAGAA